MPKVNSADTKIEHCWNQNTLSLFANGELSVDMHVCIIQNIKKKRQCWSGGHWRGKVCSLTYRRWRKRINFFCSILRMRKTESGDRTYGGSACQPDCPGVSRSDHSAGSKESGSWRALGLRSDWHGRLGLGGGRERRERKQMEEAARMNRRRTKKRMAAERTARRDKYGRWRKRRNFCSLFENEKERELGSNLRR